METNSNIRLNKFISESGICSRREADRYIEAGRVIINKRKAVIGDIVKPGDKVIVNGQQLEPRKGEELIFIALNKPIGITSTTELNVKDNIIQFVNHQQRIFPIGRLDKDSQGLIFLTNNGDLVNKILRAGNNHEKEYIVTVNKPLTEQVISAMAAGVPMLGVTTKKCKIEQINATIFKIILVQGLNRQIRRMCEHFGYEVIKLERIRIMDISLKGLPTGDWRDLTEAEIKNLYKLIATSSSEGKQNKPQSSANLSSNQSWSNNSKQAGTEKKYGRESKDKSFSKSNTSKQPNARSKNNSESKEKSNSNYKGNTYSKPNKNKTFKKRGR
jgi:23S rRNA pseudouridine2604 synthase